jgi:hypothetical protein
VPQVSDGLLRLRLAVAQSAADLPPPVTNQSIIFFQGGVSSFYGPYPILDSHIVPENLDNNPTILAPGEN